MRLLALPLLLLATPAWAGICTVSLGEVDETVRFEANKTLEHVYKVGRWPVRLTVLQSKDDEGNWVFDLKIEKAAKEGPEVLLHPKIVTAAGLDAILETSTKLGPARIHCRD